jgi:hypothetical protein
MAVDGKPELSEDDDGPCGRVVHSDPEASPTPEQERLPTSVSRKPREEKSPAEWAWERLILYIRNFENQLDREHEIAIGFTDSGAGLLRIEGVGYFDPDIVTFYGSDGAGGRSQLIQHVTQLNVVLRAIPKPGNQPEPKRIGFRLAEELDEAATVD